MVVVVPPCWSCAVAAGVGVAVVVVDEVVGAVVVPLCVFAAGAVLVVELPLFFAFAVGVVCAMTIDPVIRNALIQKLAANFK